MLKDSVANVFPFAIWPVHFRKSESIEGIKPPTNFKAETKMDPSFDVRKVAPASVSANPYGAKNVEAAHGMHAGKYDDANGNSWFVKPGGSRNTPLGDSAVDEHLADLMFHHVFTNKDGSPMSPSPSFLYSGRTHERVKDLRDLRPGDAPYRVTPWINGQTPDRSLSVPKEAERLFSQQAAAHALLGSVDVHGENWMFTPDGKVHPIDVGAVFGRRASGPMHENAYHSGNFFDPDVEDHRVLPAFRTIHGWAGSYGTSKASVPQNGEEYIEHAKRAIQDYEEKIDKVKEIFAAHPEHFEALQRRVNALKNMVKHYTTVETPDDLYDSISRSRSRW
jgi:hypothetical protein